MVENSNYSLKHNHKKGRFLTNSILFFVLFVEGYIVLSYELLALRLVMPMAGAGTQTASIVIAAVLLPLAFGYHVGGAYSRMNLRGDGERRLSIRFRIIRNFLIAAPFVTLGSSLIFVEMLNDILAAAGLKNPIAQLFAYCLIFLVPPVFYLGQTVPLVSNYFRHLITGRATGIILLVSTLGSLSGALVTTLYVMPIFGVHRAAIFLLFLLFAITLVMSPKRRLTPLIPVAVCFMFAMVVNSGDLLRAVGIVASNQYHTAVIQKFPGQGPGSGKVLFLNRAGASTYNFESGHPASYVGFVDKNFVQPASRRMNRPLNILVIGAGGFTLGLQDKVNRYTFIDIDPQLKDIAENYFLEEKLGENKEFVAIPARRFLKKKSMEDDRDLYDLIFIDTYHGSDIPAQLVTKEFFDGVKDILRPGGAVAANLISDLDFDTAFSRNILATFSSVFWPYSRQIIGNFDAGIGADIPRRHNIIYIYFDGEVAGEGREKARIYTDALNRAPLEMRPK